MCFHLTSFLPAIFQSELNQQIISINHYFRQKIIGIFVCVYCWTIIFLNIYRSTVFVFYLTSLHICMQGLHSQVLIDWSIYCHVDIYLKFIYIYQLAQLITTRKLLSIYHLAVLGWEYNYLVEPGKKVILLILAMRNTIPNFTTSFLIIFWKLSLLKMETFILINRKTWLQLQKHKKDSTPKCSPSQNIS